MLAVIQSLREQECRALNSQVIAGTVDLSSECQPTTLAVVTQNSRFGGNEPSQTKALEGLVLGRDLPAGTANRAISAVTLGMLRVADYTPGGQVNAAPLQWINQAPATSHRRYSTN